MLTKKELDYVNTLTFQAPFPGEDYAKNAMKELENAYLLYQKEYKDKEYDLILSDGDSINLEVLQKNVAHMLGIDFKGTQLIGEELYKTSGGVISQMTSYNLLEHILENADKIIAHDSENRTKLINYFKVTIKSTILQSFSNFSRFDFGVIKFNKEEYDETKYKRFSSNSNILLFIPSNEMITPHYVMGLKLDDSESKYIVETMYATPAVHEFMDNQTLVVPTQILITDNSTDVLQKISATTKEKIDILRMYQALLGQARVETKIDIFSDYESLLIEDVNKLTRTQK